MVKNSWITEAEHDGFIVFVDVAITRSRSTVTYVGA